MLRRSMVDVVYFVLLCTYIKYIGGGREGYAERDVHKYSENPVTDFRGSPLTPATVHPLDTCAVEGGREGYAERAVHAYMYTFMYTPTVTAHYM